MKITTNTKYKIGDKVYYQDAYDTLCDVFIIRDIILEGSINCLSINYIIQHEDDVRYAFEDELLGVKK